VHGGRGGEGSSGARYREGGVVEFTLYYRGPLKANAKPAHKHELRQYFHNQVKELWNQPPLNRHREFLNPSHEPTGISGNVVVTKHEEVSVVRSVGEYSFASVVNSAINLVADLTITFLRPEAPGAIVTKGGDIDNRIKTHLDALKMPSEPQDLPTGVSPTTDEKPFFFCLLEDDYLITSLNVKTDRLLDPNAPPTEVVLLIHVRTRPTIGTFGNLGLV
jgi:hypothetical protein